jgi:hypothetical protein
MKDIESIKAYYSTLTNGQLLLLAKNERKHLTLAAIEAIDTELKNRALPEKTTPEVPFDHLEQKVIDHIVDTMPKDSYQFVVTSVLNKSDNHFILGGLLERGMDELLAMTLINNLGIHFKEKISKYETGISTGLLAFVSGIAIKSLPSSNGSNLVMTTLGNIFFIGGIARMAHCFSGKRKYKKLLENRDLTILSKHLDTEHPNPEIN